MIDYPVHCRFEKPPRHSRLQIAIRLLASLVLGMFGLSLVAIYAATYVGLPAYAAARIASRGPERYLAEDAPRVVHALAWFGAVYAWFTLVLDALPMESPEAHVAIAIDRAPHPTAGSAILRALAGLPAALGLLLVSFLGAFVWLFALISALIDEHVPDGAHEFLAGMMRMALRLLSYQASLVDVYPPMSFIDTPPVPPTTNVTRVA